MSALLPAVLRRATRSPRLGPSVRQIVPSSPSLRRCANHQARFRVLTEVSNRAGGESSVDSRSGSSPVESDSRAGPNPSGLSSEDGSTLYIAIVGAVAYCSWPLGFLVNPSLAGTALASGFEGRSQPFSWLFIFLDCFAGLCTVIVAVRIIHSRHDSRLPGRSLVLALFGYAVFGVATAVDAVVPLSCGASSAQACAAQLWPLTPDDLLTAIAVLGLFVAVLIVLVAWLAQNPLPRLVAVIIVSPAIAWCAVGSIVLMGNTASVTAAAAQYAFLTLTSLLMLVVPTAGKRLLWSRPARRPQNASALESGFRTNRGSFGWWDTANPFPSNTLHSAEQPWTSVVLDTLPPVGNVSSHGP